MNRFNLNNNYKAIVIGGSAGSFQGITKILSQLPKTFPLPIIMCLHRLKHVRNGFVEALSIKSVFPVVEPYDKEQIKKGGVYLAPSNYHMSVELGNYFAMMEIVLLLATIGQRFRFTLDRTHAVEILPVLSLRPKTGIKVQVLRR